MKPNKIQIFMVQVVTGLFVLLFLYAASSKLMEVDQFQLQISKSPIITDFASILIWMVPSLEIIISILLLINRTILLGFYAALALMCLFTAYIIAILNFSDSIPCSCGGVLQRLSWTEHLIFNICFVLLAVLGIFLQTKITERKAN